MVLGRDGTTLVVSVPGYNLRPVQAFLCPSDPGVGSTVDNAGLENVMRSGCLSVGYEEAPGSNLNLRYNLESLASAQLEAFANRPSYGLLLVSGDTERRAVTVITVPAIDLAP